MKLFFDLFVINLSAIGAFLFRENFGDFVTKQAPSLYWSKYIGTLLLFNLLYFLISWIVGLYDRRQKRALLEEMILIFGIVSTSIAILIAFLFLGRMWWVSRTILYSFWFSAILFLAISRYLIKVNGEKEEGLRVDLSDFKAKMRQNVHQAREKVSIVIVNTNEKDKLINCLLSIDQAKIMATTEVIIVDNNSTDGSLELVKEKYPSVKIVENRQNLGYPRSVNNGLRQARANYCLVLNPDIIVLPGAVEMMLAYLLKHPKIGLVGCKLFNEDRTLQDSVRRFLDLRTYLYRFTPLRGLLAGSAIERFYLMQDWDHQDNRLVDWVLGGCMLVRRQAMAEVGMMDENIFLYFDDVDWCYRMWEMGWGVAYVSDAGMIHKHMRSSANKIFNRATYEHFKSLFYFLKKHGLGLPENCPSAEL